MSEPTSGVLFSVIVPTRHRNDLLQLCLKQLAPGQQTCSARNYEVIVTDDGIRSTAKSLIREKFPWVRWVQGPGRGPASNRNAGAAFAVGEWLVFTDDDCVPDNCWLEAYKCSIAENQCVQVFEGRVYAKEPRRSLAVTAPLNEAGGFLWSCNFAIRRSLFCALQGFNEAFRHAAMEDVELMYRLQQRGERVVFVPRGAVCHPWRRLGGLTESLHHQKATFLYLTLHPEERRRITSLFYLKSALRGFGREILPALVSLRFAGLFAAVVEQSGNFLMAIRLVFGPRIDGGGRIERDGQGESA